MKGYVFCVNFPLEKIITKKTMENKHSPELDFSLRKKGGKKKLQKGCVCVCQCLKITASIKREEIERDILPIRIRRE